MTLTPRLAAFCRNDVDYAPFGLNWLRGVTPARLTLLFLVSFTLSMNDTEGRFLSNARLPSGHWWLVSRETMLRLAALIPFALFILWVDRSTNDRPGWERAVAFGVATLAGAMSFAILMGQYPFLLGRQAVHAWLHSSAPRWFFVGLIKGGLLATVLFIFGKERDAAKRAIQARLAQVTTARQVAEARLQLLNAQIEPHFLFNSLASVKRLYEQQVGGGKLLLRNLNGYLLAAVQRGRQGEATVGSEVALARSFLEILHERMANRLQFQIDVPEDLFRASLPALMLGTLIENAVKHGIGPRASGGVIRIEARRDGDLLVVSVEDNGVGFQTVSGTGVGLANTRARLASLYGERGELDLRGNSPHGVTATIRIPFNLSGKQAPVVVSEAAQAERAGASEASYVRRFRMKLTWKHWAWAVGLGVGYTTFDRLVNVVSIYDNASFGLNFVLIAITIGIPMAGLLMLAIVGVEAWKKDEPSGFHYLGGWLAATLVWLASLWAVSPWLASQMEKKYERGREVAKQRNTSPVNARLAALVTYGLRGVADGALGTLVYVWLRRARRASEALALAEVGRAEADRRLITSRLEVIEAEVDPDFVFGTLETIEKTYESDPETADAMLDELIAFLRAAIPKVRGDTVGSAREVAA